jgi:hypothetical protein
MNSRPVLNAGLHYATKSPQDGRSGESPPRTATVPMKNRQTSRRDAARDIAPYLKERLTNESKSMPLRIASNNCNDLNMEGIRLSGIKRNLPAAPFYA